jgi:hypothetical protein
MLGKRPVLLHEHTTHSVDYLEVAYVEHPGDFLPVEALGFLKGYVGVSHRASSLNGDGSRHLDHVLDLTSSDRSCVLPGDPEPSLKPEIQTPAAPSDHFTRDSFGSEHPATLHAIPVSTTGLIKIHDYDRLIFLTHGRASIT